MPAKILIFLIFQKFSVVKIMFPRNLHIPLQTVVSVAPHGCFMRTVGSVCVAVALRDALVEGVLHGLCVEKVAILPKKRRKICRIGLKS